MYVIKSQTIRHFRIFQINLGPFWQVPDSPESVPGTLFEDQDWISTNHTMRHINLQGFKSGV